MIVKRDLTAYFIKKISAKDIYFFIVSLQRMFLQRILLLKVSV